MSKEKTEGQKLADKLFFNLKNCWEDVDEKTGKEIDSFAEEYKWFLDNGKTERECVDIACQMLDKNGFVNIETVKEKLKPGMRIYQNIRGKSLIAAIIGNKPVAEGCNILGAHVDSPRIDLKQNPLYEDSDLALFDTHYYGGIKKYQWTTIPLAMHGIFVDENGKKTTIKIGEEPGDPVFTITDLLPHLAKEQMEKKANEVIEGENLDILVGSRPYNDKEVKEKIKLNIMSILNKQYGITEVDFARAEIEFVPAFKASDVGLDRSLIGAYGQDDRCCAFPALKALTAFAKNETPNKTIVCYLSDKEEIGSVGNTSAGSTCFENFFALLLQMQRIGRYESGSCTSTSSWKDTSETTTISETQQDTYTENYLRLCLSNCCMLSADVNAAYDPTYASVYDKKNGSFIGKGIGLEKYTGSGGKRGASDANAEFCAKVQAIMSRNNIQWQFGELGKVDKGGGGTIALYAANLGMDVLDCGIAVLSMHSPFEVISKVDLYVTYKGYVAFLREA